MPQVSRCPICYWRSVENNSRKNEEMEPKQKQHPVMDMTDDGSKVWFCKEQYCIGTWNVRSMNQGKLEVVKQEMARANIDILGISELKWTGMGEFNSDGHYISYCRQESLRRNKVAIMVNKRVRNAGILPTHKPGSPAMQADALSSEPPGKPKRKNKAYSTRYSQAVSHPSTNQAWPCLASKIRGDRAP